MLVSLRIFCGWFLLQLKFGVIVTETIWPILSKIFTIWPFARKVFQQPLVKGGYAVVSNNSKISGLTHLFLNSYHASCRSGQPPVMLFFVKWHKVGCSNPVSLPSQQKAFWITMGEEESTQCSHNPLSHAAAQPINQTIQMTPPS